MKDKIKLYITARNVIDDRQNQLWDGGPAEAEVLPLAKNEAGLREAEGRLSQVSLFSASFSVP